MCGFIIISRRPTHPQAKLFNIDTYIRCVRARGGMFRLTDGCPAVHPKMKAYGFFIVVDKAFILVQIFTAELSAALAAYIG